MSTKIRKTALYAAFSAMIIMAGYVIFFTKHFISDKKYFYLTAAAFVAVLTCFILVAATFKLKNEKKNKLFSAVCILLIIFQVMSLPLVNFLSQTLPAGPRGTIYQFPRYSNSIAQNDVGLMMRYYLDGKTLYASEDYPKQSHNGFLFITDEYEFVKSDYSVLTNEASQEFWVNYQNLLSTITVQENPKLKIASFKICIFNDADGELILLTDEKNNWYFMTPDVYKEAFGEQ